MSQPQTSPVGSRAASRKWITYGVGLLILLIGVSLIWRNLSGNTLKDQKIAAQKVKDDKKIAAATPGDSGAFSTRLEQRRKEVEEDMAKEEGVKKKDGPLDSSKAKNTTEGGVGHKIATNGSGDQTGYPKGTPSSTTGQDAKDSEYDARKQEMMRNAQRKMGVWESEALKNTGAKTTNATNPNQALTQQLAAYAAMTGNSAGLPTTPQADESAKTPASTAVNPLVEAYMRTQGQGQGATTSDAKDKQFMDHLAANKGKEPAQPLRAQSGPGPYSLLEGASILVGVRGAVSSDKAGPCRVQVEEDVYDTVTQRVKLIPAGTTILCTYNAEVAHGQETMLLAFTKMTFPSGAHVILGGMPGSDPQGAIGAPAEVNSRFWKTFGTSFMVAAIATFAERNTSNTGTTINVSNGAVLGSAATQALADVAKKSLERNINIKPELRLKPADRLRVVVTNDMVLDPKITGVRQ
ncbi:TrbI/VirB10 family protein [Limnohabitans sp.]|uniref:TrbI/VirB10 family protein n=1 Tax=Limnohabitans sp. TaxID=1907725 RepID=UPI00286EDD74|nr:TrbI/VirB10 family protein [Limnohabitans sp.]